jgi:uncharacterized membrane protein
MSMRLQEVHPSLVHYPLALLPTSLTADLLGRVTGSSALLELGRQTMPLAAASGALAGVFGLVAQEAVRTEGRTTDLLITHRNLNLAVVTALTALAAKRARAKKPGWGYLAVGFAALATAAYSAYLGGNMVYQHGVGVSPAGGLQEDRAPEITVDNLPRVARVTGTSLGSGLRHTLEELGRGELAPGTLQPATVTG